MKSIFKFSTLSIFFILCSCSTGKRTVRLNSIIPARINIPAEIKSILLVDRTRFDQNAINIAEGVLTGELPGEDQAAVQAYIQSLTNQISTVPRFTTKIAVERLYGNSHTPALPPALPWSKVKALCNKYQTDALLAVEVFDSDFIVTNGSRVKKKTVTQDGVKKEISVN